MILSICIPTFNRKEELKELIEMLLSVESKDYEVVVTDNCSTDDTIDYLKSIQDDRLRVYFNHEPLPAVNNMIHSVFNAHGDYALYCNDRDLIKPEAIIKILETLKNGTFSFLHLEEAKSNKVPSGELSIYNMGFDALMGFDFTDHPTGMIFNMNIARKNLDEKYYYSLYRDIYTYSFLKRDLFQFAQAAYYNIGGWYEREKKYKINNKSGTLIHPSEVYFSPLISTNNCIDVMKQVFIQNDYSLTDNQSVLLEKRIIKYFFNRLFSYKAHMMSDYETAHYGLNKRFISIFAMISIVNKFYKEVLFYLKQNNYPKTMIVWLEKEKWKLRYITLFKTIKIDCALLKERVIK